MKKKSKKPKKPEEKIRIRFCPKCKSTTIIPLAGGSLGLWRCVKCGFHSSIFPEKEVNLSELKNKKEKEK